MGAHLPRPMTMTTPLGSTDAPDEVASVISDEEYHRLIAEHIPLVHHLVRETLTRVPSHVAGADLTSAGLAALAQAGRAFDPERGAKFATFASARIRGAILDELRSLDWASRSVRRRARQIDAARETLAAQEGREPDDHELAHESGLTVQEVRANKDAVARASVLSLQGFGDLDIDEVMPASDPTPEELLETRERCALLVDAIACLPHRLRKVVEDYFFAELPMGVIAAELGVTESRVSQMRAEAVERLRGALQHVLDGDSDPGHLPASGHDTGVGIAERRRRSYYDAVASRRSAVARLSSVS